MNVLQKELWATLPRARQYGRALTGDTEKSDYFLAQAASNVLKRTPAISFISKSSIVFPLLLIDFHKRFDLASADSTDNKHSLISVDALESRVTDDELLYEKIDRLIAPLPELEKRVYLLVTVAQFKFDAVSRIVSVPGSRVNELFENAHASVTVHLTNESLPKAA